MTMPTTDLPAIDPVWTESVQQTVYRAVLQATAYPGECQALPPSIGTAPGWLAVAASICDHSTALADMHGLVSTSQRDFLGCPSSATDQAPFIVINAQQPVPDQWTPALGSLLSPEGGATLLLQVEQVGSGPQAWQLQGPGIPTQTMLHLAGMHRSWFDQRTLWCAGYPRGVDLLLCSPRTVAAIPRTCSVNMKGA